MRDLLRKVLKICTFIGTFWVWFEIDSILVLEVSFEYEWGSRLLRSVFKYACVEIWNDFLNIFQNFFVLNLYSAIIGIIQCLRYIFDCLDIALIFWKTSQRGHKRSLLQRCWKHSHLWHKWVWLTIFKSKVFVLILRFEWSFLVWSIEFTQS